MTFRDQKRPEYLTKEHCAVCAFSPLCTMRTYLDSARPPISNQLSKFCIK